MRKTLVFVCVVAGLATANPILVSLLNEFSADSAHQWLELHNGYPWDTSLAEWRVATSSSECTLNCFVRGGGFIVVDSQGLADHTVGNGTFRLSPSADFIALCHPGGEADSVTYPSLPTNLGRAPCPPRHGSASYWTYDDGMDQSFNWYIDSTPTPGAMNDDYSTISGWVLVDSLPSAFDLYVWASGPYCEECWDWNYHDSTFYLPGLGAGRYWVRAEMDSPHGRRTGGLSESLAVGYGQVVSGVVIDLRSSAMTETSPPNSRLGFRADNDRLMIWLPEGTRVRLTVYDQVGRARARLTNGRLAAGGHSFALSDRLVPGVYFARLDVPGESRTAKVLIR